MSNLDLKIMCVDDEEGILEIYRDVVSNCGFTPIVFSCPEKAAEHFKANMSDIALVISDFKMPSMTGFELRSKIMPEALAVPFIVVSAYITKEMSLSALDLKIDAFLDKPFNSDELSKIIEKHSAARISEIREAQELEEIFVEEVSELFEEMDQVFLDLDRDRENQEMISLIFRCAHTIKGSSSFLTSDVITRYVHKFEDIISELKAGRIKFADEVYEVLLKGLDRLKELVDAVSTKSLSNYHVEDLLRELDLEPVDAGQVETPKNQQTVSKPQQKQKDSIAVPIEMIEQLSSCSGEITVIKNMVNKMVRALERQYIGNKDIQNLSEILDEMHKINSAVQNHITDLRKVPLAGVLKPIPRTVRDLAKELGKSIDLNIKGKDLRIDKTLATVCNNSLVHLVRNSADHGIEDAEQRKALGKPETGQVQICCQEVGEEVHIIISDDGRGIDPNILRTKALEKELFTEQELNEMSEQQVLHILFAPGFSTAAVVSDVSGRGVGMDMVRSSVEAVGGRIHIESNPGVGTTFHLKLPIPKSVLIIASLLVEADGLAFAIPQDVIQRVLRIEADRFDDMVQMASLGRVIRCDDGIYPLLNLTSVIRGQKSAQSGDIPGDLRVAEVLILEADKIRFALRVDAIRDAEEIVVNEIQAYFNPRGIFAGTTFMGDGAVGLILDAGGIAKYGGITSHAPKSDNKPAQQITTSGHLPVEGSESQSIVLFKLGTKAIFGTPLKQVFRLEEFEGGEVQHSGGERVIIYRDRVTPLMHFDKMLKLNDRVPGSTPDDSSSTPSSRIIPAIVAKVGEGYVGLEVESILDIAQLESEISTSVRDRKGVVGNALIREHNITIIDLPTMLSQPRAS